MMVAIVIGVCLSIVLPILYVIETKRRRHQENVVDIQNAAVYQFMDACLQKPKGGERAFCILDNQSLRKEE